MSTQHSQPTPADALAEPTNPATKNPSEARIASSHPKHTPSASDEHIPQKQVSEDQARAWGQGRGIHGAPAGEERKGLTEEDVGRHHELDGEQMAMPGEGRVADAVREAGRGEKGVGGEQVDLAEGLDRKKEEQAEAREAIKKQRAENTGVGGALGQQGGPASTVEY